MSHLKKLSKIVMLAVGIMVFAGVLGHTANAADISVRTGQMLNQLSTLQRPDANFPEYTELIGSIFSVRSNINKVKPQLTAFLLSDGSYAGKRYLFQQIKETNQALAVNFTGEMLVHEATADLALMTLQTIPGNEVNKLLRNAYKNTPSAIRPGILAALGIRGDEGSVKFISGYINDPDKKISLAAISSLGRIGNAGAADALSKALSRGNHPNPDALMEALLECAERFIQSNQPRRAFQIYKEIHDSNPTELLAVAAINGMMATTTDNPVNFIAQRLSNPGNVSRSNLIDLVRQLPPAYQAGARLLNISGLSDAEKMRLITILAARGEKDVYRDLAALINNDDSVIRESAIRAFAKVASPSDAMMLVQLASERTGTEQELAREGLYLLKGEEVDAIIMQNARNANDEKGVELVRAISERNITTAGDILLLTARSPHQGVRTESYRALAKITEPENIDLVIEILLKTENNRDRQELQRSLYLIATKRSTESPETGRIKHFLETATSKDSKSSLIAVLGNTKNPADLDVLLKYLDSSDEDLKLNAIRALSDWSDAGPAAKLRDIAEQSQDIRVKTLALRGFTQILNNDKSMSQDRKAQELSKGLQLAPNSAEKRLVISALGGTQSMVSLASLVDQLADSAVKNESEAAILKLAPGLLTAEPQKTRLELKRALEFTDNEEIKGLFEREQ